MRQFGFVIQFVQNQSHLLMGQKNIEYYDIILRHLCFMDAAHFKTWFSFEVLICSYFVFIVLQQLQGQTRFLEV